MTLAPLVAGGKVMVGASGGERGVRGFVAAFDPATSSSKRGACSRFHRLGTRQRDLPKGDQWKTGGGPGG